MTEIHGITEEQAAAAPSWDALAPEIARRLQGRVLAAHNLWFDRRWLDAEMERSGRPSEGAPAAGVCTLDLARGSTVEHDSNRLGDLCERYGITLERWHDAASDTEATAALLPAMLADNDLSTVGDLLATVWDSHGQLAGAGEVAAV